KAAAGFTAKSKPETFALPLLSCFLLSVLPALVEPSVLASSLARWQALHSIGFLFLLRLVVQARVVRFALKYTVNRCSLFILSIF
ncbi:TPA: hypothetical protein ACFO1K_002104, partial [Neisseria meningitidis]